MSSRISGLYAITPDGLTAEDLMLRVAACLQGGANIIQYRDKSSGSQQKLENATRLRDLCVQYNALFIVNDDVLLAKKVAANGVHIGKNDSAYKKARDSLGSEAIVGVSCYAQLDQALEYQGQGVDYVAFGRFFPSKTKPNASPADLPLLHRAKLQLTVPIVAIGGITEENAPGLIMAGADAVAVIDALFNRPNIESRARGFQRLFANQ
ncbi:MAG: thiamine phosphate synthase [Gammaproteobacteria bacterium]|nr:thiamine phosphate synthase [Gammaproteobacteria bacterium]MDH5728751.1 thiamine phosphate synthase [Gammaproteobacteria bacterium]